jgi:hypothetical protein
MAVGLPAKTTYVNGDVFSASDINDTNGTLNLVGQTTNFYSGKNKIINGDFGINQRQFTSVTASLDYTFDRWLNANLGGTTTITPQTFTLGAAPVAGYESKNFIRVVTTGQSAAADRAFLAQRMESVRTFAGQTVTVSFWAKAGSGTPKIGITFSQSFGTGGSPSSTVTLTGQSTTISTSWARYSLTFSVPSISGKTLGTNNNDYFQCEIWVSAGSDFATRSGTVGIQNNTFDIWGVQVEAGSTATAFQTASGSIQGELALCQRYLPAVSANGSSTASMGVGYASATNTVNMQIPFQVQARVAPTGVVVSSASHIQWASTGNNAATAATFNIAGLTMATVTLTVTSTSGQGGLAYFNNGTGLIYFTGCEL